MMMMMRKDSRSRILSKLRKEVKRKFVDGEGKKFRVRILGGGAGVQQQNEFPLKSAAKWATGNSLKGEVR